MEIHVKNLKKYLNYFFIPRNVKEGTYKNIVLQRIFEVD